MLKIYGDENDVFSKGYICPKAAALQDLYEDPDRLWEPVKRTTTGWRTISWEEAFDEVAKGILVTQKAHGRDALAFYLGNPSVHCLGIMTLGQLFIRSVRTRSRFSATSVDQLPHMLAAQQMFGNQVRIPVPDIDRTDFIVIVGANPLVSNGSVMTAPGMKSRLKALKSRGGTVVVIDPRRTQTAAIANEHHFIRPGTDAFLLLAIVQVLFAENLVSVGRLEALVDGVDEMRVLASETNPESVEQVTGMDAESIRALARGAAKAKRPVFYGRMGACTQEFGGLTAWLLNVLNILIGSLDEPGGAMFANPAVDLPGLASRFGLKGHYDRYRSRVRDLPEFSGELPVATMADEMLVDGDGKIRGLVSIAGNPVLSTPNGPKLESALAGLDFMVAIDPYINETTRHANIILPPTTPLERDHYDVVFGLLMVRNNAKYAPAVFERQPEQRHDWEIFAELWARLQKSGPLSKAKSSLFKRALLRGGPRAVIGMALRTGPHKLSLRKLLKSPHGVDLGALKSMMPAALATKDERIHLVTDPYRKDLARLHASKERECEFPLRLIGRRHLRSNNSWLHNSERLVKGKEGCTLLMHPDDAASYSISTGDEVTIASAAGEVRVGVEVTDEVLRGVVSLPHGWGHSRSGTQTRTAEKHAGVSMNDLTNDAAIDVLSGNAILNGVPVRLVT